MSTCNNLLIVSYEQMLHIETGASIPCDSSTLHITRKGNEAQGVSGMVQTQGMGRKNGDRWLMPQPGSQPLTDPQLGGKGCPSTKVLEHSFLSGKNPTGTANGTLERFVLSQSCIQCQGNMWPVLVTPAFLTLSL